MSVIANSVYLLYSIYLFILSVNTRVVASCFHLKENYEEIKGRYNNDGCSRTFKITGNKKKRVS